MEKAKIALIQFQLSPPKTDMENQVVINDYSQMDRVLKEERAYTLNLVKAIKKSGANVILCQKSILRDAVSDLAIHYLNKLKIMVVKDIERDQVPFICKTLGCRPVASPDHFAPEVLAHVENVDELPIGTGNNCLKVFWNLFYLLKLTFNITSSLASLTSQRLYPFWFDLRTRICSPRLVFHVLIS